jgi:hypothetical protein
MFQQVCMTIRESIYGVKCATPIGNNQANISTGTGFMIAPSVIAMAAHGVHFENDINKAVHQSFEVIRAPDVGQALERAQLIAEDTAKDIALLRLENPRSIQSVILEPNILSIGTSCGSLGFPLAFINPMGVFTLLLRFQGAFISAYSREPLPSGGIYEYYETDSLMYNGASGCPGFILNGHVFGMHNKSRVSLPQSIIQPMPQSRQQRRQQMRHRQRVQSNRPIQNRPTDRIAISLWVPSTQILAFARANGINL